MDRALKFEDDWQKNGPVYTDCHCPAASVDRPSARAVSRFHVDQQDTTGEAWHRLLALIEDTASEGRETFAPRHALPPKLWAQIFILPPEISRLKQVKYLKLYGSNLSAIPPEIGEMASLESFDPCTSRRLHWLPYEITRCMTLRDSRVSTRHLYGNDNTPFPKLPATVPAGCTPGSCSVCRGEFRSKPVQAWISLRVATDTLPLLVHACSQECLKALPTPV